MRAPGSQTYIVLQMYDAVTGHAVRDLLGEAMSYIGYNIDYSGDGLIPGIFNWLGDDELRLNVRNTNNHQTTWGVLRAALAALEEYMSHNVYGLASFTINDGAHEVGEGMIGVSMEKYVRDSISTLP